MKLLRSLLFACLLGILPLAVLAAPVNVNTADAQTLSAGLTGVGPKKAEAIIAYREAHGPFRDAGELAKVKGIGAKTLEANRERIVLE